MVMNFSVNVMIIGVVQILVGASEFAVSAKGIDPSLTAESKVIITAD
jgi:hypothetical protein